MEAFCVKRDLLQCRLDPEAKWTKVLHIINNNIKTTISTRSIHRFKFVHFVFFYLNFNEMDSSLVCIRGTGSRRLWSCLQALCPNHKSLKLITDVCHLLRFISLFIWLNKFKLLTLTLTAWLTVALRPLCVHNVNAISSTEIIKYKKERSRFKDYNFDFFFNLFTFFGLRF